MRINFRQGIVSHQSGGFLQFNGIGNVDILANTRPTTISVAEKDSNYTFTEDTNFSNAWIGPFDIDTRYWLYWNFDTQTFTRTFRKTTIQPIVSSNQPQNPEVDQIWFDISTNVMSRFTGTGWLKMLGVFAATAINSTLAPYGSGAPNAYTGTQIGITTSVRTGRPLFTSAGRCLKNSDNTFFTTENDIYINDSQSAAVRLESNVLRGKCIENALTAFTIVAYTDAGELRTAQYEDSQSSITSVLMESLTQNEVGVIVPQGVVTNPDWEWTQPTGTALWIDNGTLTHKDPHATDVISHSIPKIPVARIISPDTILFEQGLGGVGPRGIKGSVSGQSPATTEALGAVVLSTPPSTDGAPVVVSDTDPRVAGGPFSPTSHSHSAANISFIPSGDITATNVQAAILQTGGNLAKTTGATFTGPVVLSASPTTALQAATKQYVDSATSGKADSIHNHSATAISFSPSGGLSATDAQSAFVELANNKFNKTGGTIAGAINVTGTSTFNGLATYAAGIVSHSGIEITGSLSVSTTSTFGGKLTADAGIDVTGVLTISSDATVGGTLGVTGIAAFNDNTAFNADVNIEGILSVTGVVTTIDDVDVGGDLIVAGITTLSADPTTDLEAATKQYVDTKTESVEITKLPYDFTLFIAGSAAPTADETATAVVVPRTVTIEPGVSNVFGKALTPPTTTVVYEIYYGAVVVGTITFDPAVDGGIVPTYNIASLVTLSPGSHLELKPTTSEANIANVCITIIGCTTDLTCPA